MDPWAPINGISLERYADLAADVAHTQDPAAQASIVGAKGVSPIDWEAAKAGWTARMHDMSLMGQVTSAFMPMYQAALARRSAGSPDPRAQGGPPPVEPAMNAVSGAMPGAVPPPGYGAAQPSGYGAPPGFGAARPSSPPGYAPQAAPPGYAPQAPQPGYPPQPPQPGYAAPAGPPTGYPPPQPQPQPWQQQQQQQQGYRPAPSYNAQAAAFGNEVGNAFSAFGSALGSVVNSVVGTFSYGQAVMVQWSDGNRYPATVMIQQSGQVQVTFPDGRQVWVPQHCVVVR